MRDPEKEVELAFRTIDDNIYMLRLTQEEKDNCLIELEDLMEKVSQKLASGCLETSVDTLVKQEIEKYESEDIENQKKLFVKWTTEREEMFEQQLQDYKKKDKEEEVKKRLAELQNKEEILSMFERKHKIDVAVRRAKVKQLGRKQIEVKKENVVKILGEERN